MNLHVTRDAVGVLGILVVLRPGRFDGAHIVRHAVARQTELIDRAVSQQPRIRRTMTGTTFSRVSYDIPGSIQRFARARAFRDAEDRAAHEIAENIQTRLASFFVAGT